MQSLIWQNCLESINIKGTLVDSDLFFLIYKCPCDGFFIKNKNKDNQIVYK